MTFLVVQGFYQARSKLQGIPNEVWRSRTNLIHKSIKTNDLWNVRFLRGNLNPAVANLGRCGLNLRTAERSLCGWAGNLCIPKPNLSALEVNLCAVGRTSANTGGEVCTSGMNLCDLEVNLRRLEVDVFGWKATGICWRFNRASISSVPLVFRGTPFSISRTPFVISGAPMAVFGGWVSGRNERSPANPAISLADSIS